MPWLHRPWIMAAVCALGACAANLLISHPPDYHYILPLWRPAFATGIAVAAILFALVGELRRWRWAACFAMVWGVILGLVAWQGAAHDVGGGVIGWPFSVGALAALLATPLFQTLRDVAPTGVLRGSGGSRPNGCTPISGPMR